MDHKIVAWLVCGFTAFMLVIGVGVYLDEQNDTDQMKACVAAGKDWVRDGITAYYECKEVQ